MHQRTSTPVAAAGGGGGFYLDAYEVSFPLEESIERPPAYHLNQSQQMMDGTPRLLHAAGDVVCGLLPSPCLRWWRLHAACYK